MSSKKRLVAIVVLLASICLFFVLFNSYYRTKNISKNNKAFLHSLKTFSEFQEFAGSPLDNAYPGISSVKVVYDLHRKQLYFINSHAFRLHYDFCSEVLGYHLGLNLFNISNYGNQRDYYLANINYLKKNDLFVLEFSSSDEIDSLQIRELYQLVSEHSFIKNKLKLLLNNTNTLHYFTGSNTIPTCDIALLNGGLSYQMIQEGSCTGRLVVCRDLKKEYLTITPNDILIVKGTPADLPLCKAIVSDCFQTPLSHIQVLSHNKKMPSAYLQGSFTHDSILKYEGTVIKMTVTADTLMISPSSIHEKSNHPAKQIVLPLHTKIRSILPIEKCAELSTADIGTKAKGFADLKLISDQQKDLFQTPQGAFVIPFYFYNQHVQKAGIDTLLLLLERCDLNETKKLDEILANIRSAILVTPISQELLVQVYGQITKNKCGNSYRFRSSSNAEDLLNFSGAGLYESKTGQMGNPKKSVERAIKKVWASSYSYRAYQERRFATIDEKTVAMSILAHRNFPDEDINGVIITKNIYRADYPGIVINAQKGDVSTVSPNDSVTCEQLILTQNKLMNPFSKKVSAKYICYSSLHPQSPLLSYDQLLQLQKSTDAIRDYYAPKKMDWDLEFKFEKNILFIKQVRPYR